MATTQATQKPISTWQGSLNTYQQVRRQIAERWGEEEAEKYNPKENCFTFDTWVSKGYTIKKGSKALHSYTFVKKQAVTQDQDGKASLQTVKSYPKHVILFYYLQVEKRS